MSFILFHITWFDYVSVKFVAKLLQPHPISLKPSLKINFDNIWTGTYGTFCKVAGKKDIYVFGLNNYSQLGKPQISHKNSSLQPEKHLISGLKAQVPIFTPKLSKEFSQRNWSLICCAQHHSLTLDTEGKVYAIGRKEYGRLGLGKDCQDATELIEVVALKDKKVINIACGSATSFAVTEKGKKML